MTYPLAAACALAGRRIGYARVSKNDQNIELQLDALHAAGCSRIFVDEGGHSDEWEESERPGLHETLRELVPGDQFVVYKLDRFGRSMFEMLKIIFDLDSRDISFCSLTQSFDTKTALGRGILAFFAAVAEDELERIRQRTRDGLAAARKRGARLGRPRRLTRKKVMAAHVAVTGDDKEPLAVVAKRNNVAPITLKRAFKTWGLHI